MTRFEQEISGALGEFWQKNAEKEVQRAVEQADAEATVERGGAIHWNSNGLYLMDDFCEKLEYADYPFSRIATKEKHEAQVAQELAKYRANRHVPTLEEQTEMQSVFGEGATVIDVLTGERIDL